MSTPTKKASPAIERFVMGVNETALADEWRKGELAEGLCAKRFYDGVIKGHGVQLAWLGKQANGDKRSNEAQAAFDFVRHVFAVYKVGAECAAQVFDKNVKGDEVLSPDGRKPQAKRALQQSVLGSKEWGAFLKRLALIESDGAVEKRGAAERKTDKDFVLDRAKAVVNRLMRDAEKHDGSIDLKDAPTLAKAMVDMFATFGLKVSLPGVDNSK